MDYRGDRSITGRTMAVPVVSIGLIVLVLTAGCGDDKGKPQGAEAGRATDEDLIVASSQQLLPGDRLRHHAIARFEIAWPTGCDKLHEFLSEPDEPGEPLQATYSCDDPNFEGRGCAVFTILDARTEDGGPPTPAFVVEKVEDVVLRYGVQVERQRPLRADGMEGVEVHAIRPGEPGQVWIRGLLVGPDVYVLAAWNEKGACFDDEEFESFFFSFRIVS